MKTIGLLTTIIGLGLGVAYFTGNLNITGKVSMTDKGKILVKESISGAKNLTNKGLESVQELTNKGFDVLMEEDAGNKHKDQK